jgi:hypothetical protein
LIVLTVEGRFEDSRIDMAQPARTAGRPVKTHVHPHIAARICEALRLGMPYKQAALYGGVSYQTLLNWRKRADEGDSGFIEFVEAMSQAEAQGMLSLLLLIRAAAEQPRNWRAAAWILERRWPETWGRPYKSKPAPPIGEIRIHRVDWTSADA